MSQQELIARLKTDFEYFAKRQLKIRAKDGQLIPFIFNKAQRYLAQRIEEQLRTKGKIRLAILKGRQQGLSTYIGGYLYHRTLTRKGTLTFIFAHDSDGSGSLYKMVQTYYHEGVYDDLKPNLGAASQKEMSFPLLGSSYKVGTAGTSGLGRSKTIQQLHWSEVAYSPNCEEHAMGIMQAVPDLDNTAIFLESTSNGQGDFFHRTCMQALSGEGDFELVFIPWYWQDEYKRTQEGYELSAEEKEYLDSFSRDGLVKEHLIWRKFKIQNDFHGQIALFKREYPFTPQEAFEANDEEAFIKSGLIRKARDAKAVTTEAPMIFGVDPARLGGDRFVICRRRGRNILDIKTLPASDLEQSTHLLMQEINKYNPSIVNIDAGGLGVAVYDRLRAVGYQAIVRKVDFGGSASNSDKYRNKRAEMYATLRDWLLDDPCHIGLNVKDADKLQSELAVVKAKWINNSQMVMIPKEDIKKELGYSPDYADACVLTFAQPISKTATEAGMQRTMQAVTKPMTWSAF